MNSRARRDLITTIIILLIVFFGVGEWVGWKLGAISQTPIFVYKNTSQSTTKRLSEGNPLGITALGKVRQGTVTLEVSHEIPKSFQSPGQQVVPLHKVYSQKFQKGEIINIDKKVVEGRGEYQVKLLFEKATGIFRVNLELSEN